MYSGVRWVLFIEMISLKRDGNSLAFQEKHVANGEITSVTRTYQSRLELLIYDFRLVLQKPHGWSALIFFA